MSYLICPECQECYSIQELSEFICKKCNRRLREPNKNGKNEYSASKIKGTKGSIIQSDIASNSGQIFQGIKGNISLSQTNESIPFPVKYKFIPESETNGFKIATPSLATVSFCGVALWIVNFTDKFTNILSKVGLDGQALSQMLESLSMILDLSLIRLFLSIGILFFALWFILQELQGPQILWKFFHNKYTNGLGYTIYQRNMKKSFKGRLVAKCPKCSGELKVKNVYHQYKDISSAGICSKNKTDTFRVDLETLEGYYEAFEKKEQKSHSSSTRSSR